MKTLITAAARMLTLSAATVLLSAGAVLHAAPVDPVQSQDSYEAAVRDMSTSPAYVLVTLVGDRAGSRRSLCTFGGNLVVAIMRESDLGRQQAEQRALANLEHVFHFARQAALDTLPRNYSEFELEHARALLAPFSVTELQNAFSTLVAKPLISANKVAGDAIACALLERGLSPRAADIGRRIYVEPLRARAD